MNRKDVYNLSRVRLAQKIYEHSRILNALLMEAANCDLVVSMKVVEEYLYGYGVSKLSVIVGEPIQEQLRLEE